MSVTRAVGQWLLSPATQDKNNMQRLAQLIVLNYGLIDFMFDDPEQRQFKGPQKSEDNVMGRVGLTIPEAFELNYMRGKLEGIMDATGNCIEGVQEMLSGEIMRQATGSKIVIPTSFEMRRFTR